MSPTDYYLYDSLFKYVSNISVKVIEASLILKKLDFLYVSGKYLYYNNNIVYNYSLPNKKYILVGYSNNINEIKENLKTKYLELENSNTILYEEVK